MCKLHDGGALQATGRQDLCGMVAGGTTIGWLQTHYEVLYMACVQQNNYPMTSKGQAGCSTRRCSSIRVPARDQHIQTQFESQPDVNQPMYLDPVRVPARRNLTNIHIKTLFDSRPDVNQPHIQTQFESRPDVNQPTYLDPVGVPARRNPTNISRPSSSPGQM